jgi:hypothetical protein
MSIDGPNTINNNETHGSAEGGETKSMIRGASVISEYGIKPEESEEVLMDNDEFSENGT